MSFSLEGRSILSSQNKVKKETTTGNSSSESDSEAVLSEGAFEAVIPFVQVDLNKEIYLLLDKPFVTIPYNLLAVKDLPDFSSRYFENLFSYIISPNAP